MDTVLGSGDEGSGDDLCFENYMAQQEHGARSRYRQVAAHLHYNNSEEVDGERGNRGQERLREGSERSRRVGRGSSRESPNRRGVLGASQEILSTTFTLSGRSPPQGSQPKVGGSCPLQSSDSPISQPRCKKNGN
jgi:hypothetical protein